MSLSHRFVRLLAASALAMSAASSSIAQNAEKQGRDRAIVPAGTIIPVRLDTTLNSKKNRPGDRFTGTVKYGPDDAGLPEGTRVEGTVRESLPAEEGKPGVLDVDFTRIIFPGGETRPLEGSLMPLKGKGVKRASDGRLIATSDKSKDRLKFIGIGAGAGLLIGALTKNSSLISVLLGAGAGYAANELTNKKPGDVNLKSGSEFGVRLERQLTFYPTGRRYRPNPDEPIREEERDHRRERDNRESGEIGVLVDDRDVRFDSARPIRVNDTYLIPMNPVASAAKANLEYDSEAKMIRSRNGDLRLAIGSRVAMMRDSRKRLDAAAEVRNGVVYVPMEFVALAVNGTAFWDAPSRTIVITTNDHSRHE